MAALQNISMTEDTLKNILLMAPMLDEVGQNRVFGLMCGLLANTGKQENSKTIRSDDKLKN